MVIVDVWESEEDFRAVMDDLADEILAPDVVFFGPRARKASVDGRRSFSSSAPCAAIRPTSDSQRSRLSSKEIEWRASSR
jgi:hypothetical protein